VIELDHVSLRRDGQDVLRDVTLRVGAEVVVLIGRSGSGKSTLLRMILGFEAPTEGRVLVDGRVLSAAGRVLVLPEERRLAMVFQDLALWPHLRTREQLALVLGWRGLSRGDRDARIAEALAWVDLGAKRERYPHELSGGEQQRVAIARALVQDPAALLLDEPLGSLDVALKSELLALFERLFAERRVPVIYSTHDPYEAARLGGRVVVLEQGAVAQEGALRELAREPRSEFVRVFAGHASRMRD
jgi:iron(III) transport system ATP-binding protein